MKHTVQKAGRALLSGGHALRAKKNRVAGAAVFAALALPCGILLLAHIFPNNAASCIIQHPSWEMTDRNGQLLHAFMNQGEQWCFPRTLKQVSPKLVQATIAVEDQRFYWHCGVDPMALARACVQNVWHTGVASGASTLSMQVVKMRPQDSRSILGKAGQIWNALRLEAGSSKDEILTTYLNKAPYGLNLIGAEAAARRYFGKPAMELTLPEAALLAGLPKSPNGFQPLKHAARAKTRRNYVLHRMHEEGFISQEEFARAKKRPLNAAWHEFPRLAPHLAQGLHQRKKDDALAPVTLDADVQSRVESLITRHLRRFDHEVNNAAAIVVDVASASVLARAGGADFFMKQSGGQMDLCQAPRSPGSTLKPFTYALAIENQKLYASERLLDDTLDLGQYNPENFDGYFNGLVTATDALRFSLNVPAVMILERLGADTLHRFLLKAGLSTLSNSPEHYGLGLTLGNCEVRLDEMAAAYRMLADLGVYTPLRTRAEEKIAEERRVLSRGTALTLYTILNQSLPQETDSNLAKAVGVLPKVCWKTGTSTGYHDAWTFMYNRQYVVGVWVGNSDGKPSQRLVGAWAALPLAAAIFRSLPPLSSPAWPDPGDALKSVKVCSLSGLPASEYCPHTQTVILPRDQYLHRQCDMHYPNPSQQGIVERWPGSARTWDLAHIMNPVTVEPLKEGGSVEEKVVLRIKSPANKAHYVLTGETGGDRIRLDASLEGNATLHWYLDDRYLGTSSNEAPLYLNLATGEHKVSCMTPNGVTDVVNFEVTLPDAGTPLKTS
ncbi:MAG TPA: penicillin-binding protein 1C [Candidatus Hydrogenedentes bacterium]|nr:penicillin-binding protein 1C [Candidatus Hydrogenedentota bacterium]